MTNFTQSPEFRRRSGFLLQDMVKYLGMGISAAITGIFKGGKILVQQLLGKG